MKTLIFVVIAMLVFASTAWAQDEEESKTFLRVALTTLKVSDMPLSVRDVPNHPDDGFASGTEGPIEKTNYSLKAIIEMGRTVKKVDRRDASLKMNVNWIYGVGTIARRNYTNAIGTGQRGYGAALTYCQLTTRGMLPNITSSPFVNLVLSVAPELVWERKLGEKKTIGCSVGYFRLVAENGWDRYDNYEIRNAKALANCFPIGIAASVGDINLAAKYYLVSKSSLGREAGISGNFGFSAGVRF